MKEEKYKQYLYDLGILLKEKAFLAKTKESTSKGTEMHSYNLGALMALHDVISIMQQQADVFGINVQEIGLNEIDPERDLL